MNKILENNKKLFKVAGEKGFYHLLSANFLVKFFGFSSQLLVAWILTPEDMGRIKVMQSFMSVFIILAGFGFNESIIKLCSENVDKKEKFYLYQKGVFYTLPFQFVTFILILILINFELLSKDEVINSVFIIYAFGLLLLPLNSNFLGYLHALKKIKEYSKIQIITKIFGVALIIILTYFFSIWGYAFGIIIGYVITLLTIFLRNRKLFIMKAIAVKNPFKKHFSIAFISALTNLVGMLLYSIDIFVINYMSNDRREIGYYAFATIFIGLLSIVARVVLKIAKPYFSERSDDFNAWHQTYTKYQRVMTKYLIIVLIMALIFVSIFLSYIFNAKYSASIYYFVLLSIGWFFRDLGAFRGVALFGLGKIKTNFFVSLVTLIITLPAVYIFYKIGGIEYVPFGVILGSISMLITSHLTFNYVVNRISNND